MKPSEGTPQTLLQAIINGMCIGPASEAPASILVHVEDFLAQRVTVALCHAKNPDEEIIIRNLWRSVVGREILTNNLTATEMKGTTTTWQK